MSTFIASNFPHMIYRARVAAKRAELSQSEQAFGALDALIYSALSLEAFINDFPELADILETCQQQHTIPTPQPIKVAIKVLRDLENQKASTLFKYEILHFILTGQQFDHGKHPHQDMVLLFRLRNDVVHPKLSVSKTEDRVVKRPESINKVIDRLKAQGILAAGLERIADNLHICLETKSVARWSVATAIRTAEYFIQISPDSFFKKHLSSSYLGKGSSMKIPIP